VQNQLRWEICVTPYVAIFSQPAPKRAFSSLSVPFYAAGKTQILPRNKKAVQNKPHRKEGSGKKIATDIQLSLSIRNGTWAFQTKNTHPQQKIRNPNMLPFRCASACGNLHNQNRTTKQA
jgi:hypothetical protein